MDAALVVIARDGVDAVKMNALAVHLRVSVAAPFRHFATREALLVALAEEGALAMVAALDAASDFAPPGIERERARGIAYVRFAVEEPAYFRLVARPELVAMSQTLRSLAVAHEASMDAAFAGQAPAPSSSAARVSAGVLAAQALTYGLARMVTDGLLGDVSADDAEALAREVTSVLGVGLLPR